MMSQLSVWKSIKGGYPPNASVPPKAPFWYQGVLQELAMEEAGAMSIEGRDAKPDLDAEIAAFGGKMQDSAFARSIEVSARMREVREVLGSRACRWTASGYLTGRAPCARLSFNGPG